MSETHTTPTVYGDVQIETRTCASCGMEYLPEDTETLYAGNVSEVSEYSSFTSVQFKPSYREVYFCGSCQDQPISYILPSKIRVRYRQLLAGILFGVIIGALLL